MKRRLRVRLNIPLLIEHFSREQGQAMTEDEVFQWLTDAGFKREDKTYWIVAEPDLGQVDPAEVLEVEPLE